MRKLFSLVLALFMVCGMSVRALAADAPIELSFLNFSTTDESMKSIYKVIEDFEKDNPGIKIKNIGMSVDNIRNQLVMANLASNAPDVAQVQDGDAVVLQSTGAVYSAEEIFDKKFTDSLVKEFYDLVLYNGKHAGIVFAPNSITFFYNKKLLKQLGYDAPPKTLEEMEAMMKKGKAEIKDLIGFQLDTTIRSVGFDHQWNFMNLFEYKVLDGKTSKFNSPAMAQFGEWERRMIKEGYTLPGKRYGEFRPMAAQGRLLFAVDNVQHRGFMKAFNKTMTDQEYEETWGVAPMPLGPSGKRVSSPHAHTLVVLRATKHKEAAAKFVEYLTASQSALTKYLDPAGFLPPVSNYKELAPGCFEDKGRQGTMRYAVPYTLAPCYGPNYAKLGTIVTTAIQEIISSDRPIKQILDSYQPKIVDALALQ